MMAIVSHTVVMRYRGHGNEVKFTWGMKYLSYTHIPEVIYKRFYIKVTNSI